MGVGLARADTIEQALQNALGVVGAIEVDTDA
jgi:hypothetical protein